MIYTSREVYEYISHQTNSASSPAGDPIVERKTCAISGMPFPIYQSDLDFYTKISPTFAGEKFQIPTPTLCPEERQRRRLSFRNERRLYKRNCDATGDQIISIYSPDNPYKVYNQKFWRSDARDPMEYGMDFDFSKTFKQQFGKLMITVPRLQFYATQNENCEYLNGAAYNKSCYLIFASDYNTHCLYGDNLFECNDCYDSSNLKQCSLLYGSLGCELCSMGRYLINCKNCSYLIDCTNCINCSYCKNCINLSNKKFCFNNIQYSEKEYYKIINNALGNKLNGTIINPSISGNGNNFSYGNYITNCSESLNVFSCHEMNQCKNIVNGNQSKNCYDSYVIIENSERCYENVSSIGLYNCCFTTCCWNANKSIRYSDHCQGSNNLFGCIGLRNRSYCIFNKQYSKEDYEIMVGKIIRHMMSTGERGEFFHPSLSPFGYNETVAQEYYPIEYHSAIVSEYHSDIVTKTDSTMQLSNYDTMKLHGYHRSTYSSDPKIPDGVKTIDCRLAEWAEDSEQWQQLNQMVVGTYGNASADDNPSGGYLSLQQNYDICKQIILCEISGRPFMLQKAEIDFYRKHHISLPRKHPDIRHEERMKLRPGRTLYLRNCDCCGKEMLSVYPVGTHGNVSGLSGEIGNADRVRSLDSEATDSHLASGGHESMVYCESCYQKEIYG